MEKTSLNKIGCGSEKENERVPFFFAHLALSFDKTGCGSEKENERVPFFFDKTGCTSEKLK